MIKCYHPPTNMIHLSDVVFVPKKDVFEYTKELYEVGLSHKASPPPREAELREFFRWRAVYLSAGKVRRAIIDLLLGKI